MGSPPPRERRTRYTAPVATSTEPRIPADELKIARKRMPATSEEPIPIRIVSPIVIGSGPGRASRPRPPTMAPHTSRNRMKAIMPDLLATAGSAAALLGYPEIDTAKNEQRQQQAGQGSEDRPEDEAEDHPADDADADRLTDRPRLLPGQDRPQRHPEEGPLDEQADHEPDHVTLLEGRRPRPARRGTSISSGLREPWPARSRVSWGWVGSAKATSPRAARVTSPRRVRTSPGGGSGPSQPSSTSWSRPKTQATSPKASSAALSRSCSLPARA